MLLPSCYQRVLPTGLKRTAYLLQCTVLGSGNHSKIFDGLETIWSVYLGNSFIGTVSILYYVCILSQAAPKIDYTSSQSSSYYLMYACLLCFTLNELCRLTNLIQVFVGCIVVGNAACCHQLVPCCCYLGRYRWYSQHDDDRCGSNCIGVKQAALPFTCSNVNTKNAPAKTAKVVKDTGVEYALHWYCHLFVGSPTSRLLSVRKLNWSTVSQRVPGGLTQSVIDCLSDTN